MDNINETLKNKKHSYTILGMILCILIIIIIILTLSLKQDFTNTSSDTNIKDITQQFKTTVLSNNPKIIYIHDFISNDEATHFIKLADQLKKPSTIDSIGNPTTLKTDVRSSNTAHIDRHRDNIVKSIEQRGADFINSDIKQLEPLQVVVYEKGQKYVPHYDFFSSDSPEIIRYGNRNKTILIYLNDLPDNAGGSTYFPKLDIRVKPKANDAIYFENMNDGKVNWDTLHTGEELLNNYKKYAVNMWFREKNIY
jgi:prolyl 4-hydroxylase